VLCCREIVSWLAAVDDLIFYWLAILRPASNHRHIYREDLGFKATTVQLDVMLCCVGFQIRTANTIPATLGVRLFGRQQTTLDQTPHRPVAQVQRFGTLGNSHKVWQIHPLDFADLILTVGHVGHVHHIRPYSFC
jgi:hypothetical protein